MRSSVLTKTWSTSVTATPLLIVTRTSCSLISSTPPRPPSAMSRPAAKAGEAMAAPTIATIAARAARTIDLNG